MAYSQGNVNAQLVGVYVSTAGLYSGVCSMVNAGSAQGCGLAQLLTFEDSRFVALWSPSLPRPVIFFNRRLI